MWSAGLPQDRMYRSLYGSSPVYALTDLQYDQKLRNPAFSSFLLERAGFIIPVLTLNQHPSLQHAVIWAPLWPMPGCPFPEAGYSTRKEN